ncbi:hypothetical protein GCM10010918_14720 [Paenibacillus radicis (ex Gao et al. 2016)]|uniref:Uncharacterized protein n=1 Tax=Paenibacillus radicis (ex Gao et al. 2016) TaxID=1737354 RepID=A0A917GZ26_9BACL|nr:hypothetical protein GCM10010918_14720 [Paenibacillus radicis (ex Gao et al. 2016)]
MYRPPNYVWIEYLSSVPNSSIYDYNPQIVSSADEFNNLFINLVNVGVKTGQRTALKDFADSYTICLYIAFIIGGKSNGTGSM